MIIQKEETLSTVQPINMPDFFVIARVVGSDEALPKVCNPKYQDLVLDSFELLADCERCLLQWKERVVALCEVSATEPYSTSYYWGHDVDGEPDTLWGLEGYGHAIGFFIGHPASEVFKQEMKKVDDGKLLRHVQGLGSPDYDLHYYDFYDGFLTRVDDQYKDARDSFVVILHFWAQEGRRKELIQALAAGADRVKKSETQGAVTVQSFAVLKECLDVQMASVYIR